MCVLLPGSLSAEGRMAHETAVNLEIAWGC